MILIIVIIVITILYKLIGKKKVTNKYKPYTTTIPRPKVDKPRSDISPAEIKIKNYLDKNNIKYIREYKFEHCISKDGHRLRYDFYIPDKNTCIEYDGKQHFNYVPSVHGPDKTKGLAILKKQQERDEIKNDYCKLNKIKLIRLNSSHFYRINEVLTERLK